VSQLERPLSVVMLGVVMLDVVAPSAMPGREKMHLLSGTKLFSKKKKSIKLD
jgi:hypothetical protein